MVTVTEIIYDRHDKLTRSRSITLFEVSSGEVWRRIRAGLGVEHPKPTGAGRYCRFCGAEMLSRYRGDMRLRYWLHPRGAAKGCPMSYAERSRMKLSPEQRFIFSPPPPVKERILRLEDQR